jgi:hypothetical protein
MATKTTPQRPGSAAPHPSSNGHGGSQRMAVAPPKGRVRLPELAIGLFVMVAFALGAVLWHLSSVDQSPAVAIAADVERGETITASDVRVVYVASDDGLATLSEAQMSQVVGRVALVDLPAGTLVTRSLVADAVAIQAGDGVAGLSLEPGQYPALGLAPGDVVNVVRSAGDPADGDGDSVIARNATVFAVEDLASDRKLVSIMTSEADAESVASEAGSGSLRLVLVSP